MKNGPQSALINFTEETLAEQATAPSPCGSGTQTKVPYSDYSKSAFWSSHDLTATFEAASSEQGCDEPDGQDQGNYSQRDLGRDLADDLGRNHL